MFGNDYPTVDGTGVRDYIHVLDLAEGHVAAMERLTEGVNVYNLGTGRGTSVLELVKAFEEANGIEVPYEIVDRRPGDIASCYADASKASENLVGQQNVILFRCVRMLGGLRRGMESNGLFAIYFSFVFLQYQVEWEETFYNFE